MRNPPRIWVDYRPIRIGWVIPDADVAQLVTAAQWNSCLWGGRHNCIIPAHDPVLADRLIASFGVDLLLPVRANGAATAAFISRYPHLEHHRWRDSIFHDRHCEFADIRHPLRRIIAHQDHETEKRLRLPVWQDSDPLAALFTMMLGAYPRLQIKSLTIRRASTRPLAQSRHRSSRMFHYPRNYSAPRLRWLWLDMISNAAMSGAAGSSRAWCSDRSVTSMRSSCSGICTRQAHRSSSTIRDMAHDSSPMPTPFWARLREPPLGREPGVTFWIRADRTADDSWKPDLDLDRIPLTLSDGRGDVLWNGMNIKPRQMRFSAWHRDVVPAYTEADGKARASFTLPDRPFDDEDVRSLSQKFAVVVDASQYGEPDVDFTFETPFVPRLNEFYGRELYFDPDAVRSQRSQMHGGAIALIIGISTQNLTIHAFRVFDWLRAFFKLCQMDIARSEAGLRCERLITQLGGLQDCRVLKIRGVRDLLRKYTVEQHFTRSGALAAIRDVDAATQAVGFDAFKNLFIEYREKDDLTPDDVLRYLLSRRVFRVGLELTCPNCQLPSWVHLDDVKTHSACAYCDHHYDVTSQLKDRDWRYRRSGIFGRDDDQLGGVPVAVTLQQLSTALREHMLMYTTGVQFTPRGAAIEPCESDFVVVSAGAPGISEAPVQIVIGETKSGGVFDGQDVRKLGRLADALPQELADVFILFSKTGTFSPDEIALAKTLNTKYRRRVILWSREELEPYYPYERSKEKLGNRWRISTTLKDLADNTHALFFKEAPQSSGLAGGADSRFAK